MCSRNQPPSPSPPPRKKERTPCFLLSRDVLRENSHSKGTVYYLVFFLCVFSQGGKQFFPSYTELARASLPAGIACVAGAINKRLSCNKVIWAGEKTRHTRVVLFFLRPFFLSLCAALFLAYDRRPVAVAGQFFLSLCLLMRWVGQICMVTFRSLLFFSLQEIHAGYLWLIGTVL